MIGQFVLSLSILITLHECGHFFPARWFKTRVEKFYLFFDPWFSLFKMKKGETEYGIGWLPLGGYVKISGMIDESFDKEQMQGPPQPWEFRSKKAWQRLIIMLGGVTVNFILGILLFGMILFVWGKQYISNDDAEYGIVVGELGTNLGLQDGDKVLTVGDLELEKFNPGTVSKEIIINGARTIGIERAGQKMNLTVDDEVAKSLSSHKNQSKILYGIRFPTTVWKIAPGLGADKAGIQSGDQIISVNKIATPFYDQLGKASSQFPNQEVSVGYMRGQDTLNSMVQLDSLGRLGFGAYDATHYFDYQKETFSLGTSLVDGWHDAWGLLGDQLKAFSQMFAGKLSFKESVGGPIAIATLFKSPDDSKKWDWLNFWRLTAMLSMILGFMNLLPIPALDGGHVMFLLWEVITGRKPSDKVIEYATLAGFIILVIFMVFVFANDIARIRQ